MKWLVIVMALGLALLAGCDCGKKKAEDSSIIDNAIDRVAAEGRRGHQPTYEAHNVIKEHYLDDGTKCVSYGTSLDCNWSQ